MYSATETDFCSSLGPVTLSFPFTPIAILTVYQEQASVLQAFQKLHQLNKCALHQQH